MFMFLIVHTHVHVCITCNTCITCIIVQAPFSLWIHPTCLSVLYMQLCNSFISAMTDTSSTIDSL